MKNKKNEMLNLFLSAFLIIAYIVCSFFFLNYANTPEQEEVKPAIYAGIFLLFGLLVFYATRVGEGKAVARFSIATLVVLDLPALYIVLACLVQGLPFHTEICDNIAMMYLAAVALGYGLPYTFFSGFETASEDEQEEEKEELLEGGVAADISEADEEKAPEYEADADEIVIDTAEIEDGEEEAEE